MRMNKHQNPNNFIENETQTDDTNSNESQLKVERIVICFVSRATLQGYFEIDVTNVSIKTAHSVAPFHSFHITHYALCLPSLLFILVIFARFLSFFSCLLRASNLSKKKKRVDTMSQPHAWIVFHMPKNTKQPTACLNGSRHNVYPFYLSPAITCQCRAIHFICLCPILSAIVYLLYRAVYAFGMFRTKVIVSN